MAYPSILIEFLVRGQTSAIRPSASSFYGSRRSIPVFVLFSARIGRNTRIETSYSTSRSLHALTGARGYGVSV